MNKWKLTFIFFSGFMLRELMGHIWLSAEGMLPFTSRLFGFTLTPEMNTILVIANSLILLVCAYFGFVYHWEGHPAKERHA